jgi:drug/metabolite transporter (DMT)-like permease
MTKLWPYHLLAIIVIFIWGVTFVNTKVLMLHGMTAAEIFMVRFLLAYVGIWFFSPRRLWADNWRDELLMLLLGITGGSLYFVAENVAVGISYVSNVSFIVCTAPLITTILALLFIRNVKAAPRLIVGSILALLGVGIVIFNGHFVLRLNPLGDALALAAAICWAAYSLLMRLAAQRYEAVFITRKVFAYGLLTMLPFFLFMPWQFPLQGFSLPVVWGNLLFLGLVASFACFILWNLAIGKVGALKTSNYVYLNPITTVIAGSLILHEPLTLMAFFGSAMILLGVWLANTAKDEK